MDSQGYQKVSNEAGEKTCLGYVKGWKNQTPKATSI